MLVIVVKNVWSKKMKYVEVSTRGSANVIIMCGFAKNFLVARKKDVWRKLQVCLPHTVATFWFLFWIQFLNLKTEVSAYRIMPLMQNWNQHIEETFIMLLIITFKFSSVLGKWFKTGWYSFSFIKKFLVFMYGERIGQ